MTGWALALGLALAAFAGLVLVLKVGRKSWEALGASLLFGLAGFAFQANTGQPGAPKQSEQKTTDGAGALIDARKQLDAQGSIAPNRWIVIADALSRNGQYGDAAAVVLGAVESNPDNADAWLSLANNLVAHAEGNLTPPAAYAYEQAGRADPTHPGPPFFLGLALAQQGKFAEGRRLWADLLARSPADAPWRADLAQRLARLDAFIAAQGAGPKP